MTNCIKNLLFQMANPEPDMKRCFKALFLFEDQVRIVYLAEKLSLAKTYWEWKPPIMENGIIKDSNGEELEIINIHPFYDRKDFPFLIHLNGYCSEPKTVQKNQFGKQTEESFPTEVTTIRDNKEYKYEGKIVYCMNDKARLINLPMNIVNHYMN